MAFFKLKIFLVLFMLGCETSQPVKNKSSNILESYAKLHATVVIDAGHGGEDSGAVGSNGLKEKDLSLDIARRIRRLMKIIMPNVNIIMTREGDRWVGLEERLTIAHKAQADLFISVHINSSENKEAAGFEIYSLDTASDRHAERLAARENKDLQKDNKINYILADLRAHAYRSESDKLARYISQNLSSQINKNFSNNLIKNRGYNQAIFHVLFVKMPAVLAELLFISNPEEEKLLGTAIMRESCARGLVAGIGKYLATRKNYVAGS